MPENYNRTPNTKCCICNKNTYIRPNRLNKPKKLGFTCSRKCAAKLKSIEYKFDNNPKWKGGTTNDHGYLLIFKPDHPRPVKNCYIYAHHLVMEEHLGRKLKFISQMHPDNEVVHHINGDKTDNRLENLSLLTVKTHNQLHRRFFELVTKRLLEKGYLKWDESKKNYDIL